MSYRLSRLLNRLWLLGILAPLAIGFSFYMGMVIGVRRWPYEVQNTTVITPNVPPGAIFNMARTIDYQDDCELHYDRLMVSNVPGPQGAFRRDVLADINFARPPMEADLLAPDPAGRDHAVQRRLLGYDPAAVAARVSSLPASAPPGSPGGVFSCLDFKKLAVAANYTVDASSLRKYSTYIDRETETTDVQDLLHQVQAGPRHQPHPERGPRDGPGRKGPDLLAGIKRGAFGPLKHFRPGA